MQFICLFTGSASSFCRTSSLCSVVSTVNFLATRNGIFWFFSFFSSIFLCREAELHSYALVSIQYSTKLFFLFRVRLCNLIWKRYARLSRQHFAWKNLVHKLLNATTNQRSLVFFYPFSLLLQVMFLWNFSVRYW